MSMDGPSIASLTISVSSSPISTPCSPSPRNRVKFLCSHGGRILPLPASVPGHLKYVGGETRVISVPRDITFQELMKKLTYQIDGDMALKYQAVSEDLDALVSVKSNEDLRHMLDEVDLYEIAGSPTKLRAFLFPVNAISRQLPLASPACSAPSSPRSFSSKHGPLASPACSAPSSPRGFSSKHCPLASPACSSPSSPHSYSGGETNNGDFMLQSNAISMLKAQSSPSISSSHYYANQRYPQYCYSHRNGGPEMLGPGRADWMRYHVEPVSQNHCCASRQNQGGGCCIGSFHPVDWGHSYNKGTVVDRNWGLTSGSVQPSLRYGEAA